MNGGQLLGGVTVHDLVGEDSERTEIGSCELHCEGLVVQRHLSPVSVLAVAANVADALQPVDHGRCCTAGGPKLRAEPPGGQGFVADFSFHDQGQRPHVSVVESVTVRKDIRHPLPVQAHTADGVDDASPQVLVFHLTIVTRD